MALDNGDIIMIRAENSSEYFNNLLFKDVVPPVPGANISGILRGIW